MPKHGFEKRAQRAKRSDKASPTVAGIETARAVALAGFTALFVATPLVPSDSVAELGIGAVPVMLWLLLLVAWLAARLILRQSSIRFGWVDAAITGLLVLFTVSAFMMADKGHARATINALWQWIGFGVLFFLARQLLRERDEARAVCAVVVSLAVCLSMFGFYQYFYSMPRMRAEYAQDPDVTLREEGIPLDPESPERKLFEDRLNSTEPMATFALTNSFAGFLAPWLVAALAIGVTSWRTRELRWPTAAAVAMCCLIVGLCLLMTKSRTALLATAIGLVLLAFQGWRGGRRIDWRIPVAGGVVFALLLAGAIAAGSLDRLVLSETLKSGLYRFQYWRSTLAMIADYPWFGCGPGNFQQYYTAYKLPEASETIADPHNFLLEVWATAGTPAAIAFLLIVVVFACRLVRSGAEGEVSGFGFQVSGEEEGRGQKSEIRGQRAELGELSLGVGDEAGGDGWNVRWIYGGAVCGVLLAFPLRLVAGFPLDGALLWIGLPVAVICASLLHAWTVRGSMPVWVPAVAAVVLLVNLLAAGGIGFPGVAQNWWLLVAIALNRLDAERPLMIVPRTGACVLVVVAIALALAAHQTMYQPVLRCQARTAEGKDLAAEGRVGRAETALRDAAAADRRSAEPWMDLAALYHQLVIETNSLERLQQFDNAVEETLKRNRRSHSVFRQLGNWRLVLYVARREKHQLDRAIEAYSTSVGLHPNSSMAHAQLAWACKMAGDGERAASEAEKALLLDMQNPHRERQLARQKVFDPTGDERARQDAEQLMHSLRKKGRRITQ